MKRTPLKRGRPAKRPSLQGFWEAVTDHGTAPCWLCAQGRGGPCGGKLDAHHWVEQQAIRSHFNTLIYEALTNEHKHWLERRLSEALTDPRNGSPIRRWHHDQLTNHRIVVTRDQLPPAVEEFADDYGVGHLLDRVYGTTTEEAA